MSASPHPLVPAPPNPAPPAPSPWHDPALLQALAEGDQTAWRLVVDRYRGLLHHVARKTGLSPEQREDVLQTTWMRLLEHATDIRRPEGLASWLVTTASREAMATRRRLAREQPTETLHDGPADTEDVDHALHIQAAAGRLRSAVALLPPRERLVLEELMTPEQPSYAQVATTLRMPIGAIGPIRQRALRRLAPVLDGCWTA